MDESLRGVLDLTEEPPAIHVYGSVIVYRDDDAVEIDRIETREGDISVLLLKVRVKEGVLPMKGVMRTWEYQEKGEHVRMYTHVQVHGIEGGTGTVEVRALGPKS
ncbi:MAG TPA: hypothetical protein VK463_18720 [Desulfomonilaceae bacterium]|nr:hypothetical protein [Desulfomonilaceae bacterium]